MVQKKWILVRLSFVLSILRQKKELKKKLEQSESHNKDLQKKLDHSEAQKKELQKKLEQSEAQKNELEVHKQMNEMATVEQTKVDEKMLAEELKRVEEKLHKIIIELEKQLDAKQVLELEIEQMRGALRVMKHEDEDMEAKKKMDEIQEKLKEKQEEYTNVEQLFVTLIFKERRSNDEVEEARKELVSGLWGSNSRASIGVKIMGVELCSLWQEHLRDPSWHPFRIITDKEGKTKEIINEEDDKLKALKNELGDEVCEKVTTTMMELNEYNASGRYTIPELWNFEEGRKASLEEGVVFLLNKWKLLRKRKR
ncbi:hypothetical protein L3X38_031050 [Prunus dulcis]|uniref:Factor of DNA methylation 1-5/IDN2 domain-containing protein n=1 Tax=Prunus dulcis TaxID=3755 RepID=A0AAD4VBS3_PRUDU|nr:hypothetical protein L3X38_031050 [Prunus dulcis]